MAPRESAASGRGDLLSQRQFQTMLAARRFGSQIDVLGEKVQLD
jgi:hypothetical protein